MRLARYIGLAFLALIVCTAIALYLTLRGSLPQIEGKLALAGLHGAVTIERDANGVPTIRATDRHDLALATGFVHGQDRFFQMDLLRRAGAGELADLLGSQLVEIDRARRPHEFRRIARAVLENATAAQRDLLDAYATGVNQAMNHWRTRPWEYWLLRVQPRRWITEDSLLVAYAMYFDLNDSTGEADYTHAKLRDAMPRELFAFMHPLGSEWDAPIDGGSWRAPPMPGPEIMDLRRGSPRAAALSAPELQPPAQFEERSLVGSNSWAVGAAQTHDGKALLANDMHIGLRVPHIWYRARMIVSGEAACDLVGVTLPGMPALVVGSNGHIAWGFTNSYGDWTDVVVVEPDPQDATKYLTSEGSVPFEVHNELISVRGAKAISLTTRWTRWGPVLRHDENGRDLVVAWTAHEPRATNLNVMELENARTVDDALSIANRSGIAVQNFLVADSAGHIGWTVIGQVPVRSGYDSRFPASWRDSKIGWTAWREPEEYPRVIDPPSGRLWTANARTINADTWMNFLGDGGHDLGARASQIRDALLSHDAVTAGDLAALQTDDRALFLTRWHDLLLDVLKPDTLQGHPLRQQVRNLVEKWSAHAAVDDAGYRIVHEFRNTVFNAEFSALTAQARLRNPQRTFVPSPQFESPLWQLVTRQPVHLLDPRYQNWHNALLAWVDTAADRLVKECGALAHCTWGERNTLHMRHPLSGALPLLGHFVDLPAEAVPGDVNMPRVQGQSFGASERLVVSPGQEAQGLFSMPGGQSGHPLSPFYTAGHETWVQGKTLPLLPGAAASTLHISPVATAVH